MPHVDDINDPVLAGLAAADNAAAKFAAIMWQHFIDGAEQARGKRGRLRCNLITVREGLDVGPSASVSSAAAWWRA